MPTIEEIAISNYQTNMDFLRKRDQALFNRLSALEHLLENGKYPQRYDLEYKDDYFDVIELGTENYLYNTDSNIYSDTLVDNITYKKDDQVCETFYNLQFTQKAVEKANASDADVRHATTAPIFSYYHTFIDPHMSFKRIHKFIFIGSGLGLHLSKAVNKIDPEVILLIEEDLELFRLSLFTCDYEKVLAGRIIYFSVGENQEELTATLNSFYTDAFGHNQYLKFLLFSSRHKHIIQKLQTYIITRPEKCYSHERILYKNAKVLQRIQEGYDFLDLTKKEHETFFKERSVLIIGAGPSLHQNVDWLKEHQGDYILIAVFAALKTLQKNDISPDIVIQIDEKVTEGVNLLNSFDDFDFVKDSLFIFSASVPDVLFERFPKERTFLVEDRSHYKQKELHIVAASVGEVAYSLSLIFNAAETYLLGLDLAVADDGSTHAKDHHGAMNIDVSESEELDSVMSLQTSSFRVKGNFKDSVMTTPLLGSSIPMLNRYTKLLRSPDQQVFNLCDGAYFEDTTPLHIADIHPKEAIDKRKALLGIQKLLKSHSNHTLTEHERKGLQRRQEQIAVYFDYLRKFQHTATSSEDQFTDAYKKLISSIIDSRPSELKELIFTYFFNTTNYVIDFFNTQELKNPKKHTKKLKKIVMAQLEKILDYYETSISSEIR